MKAIETKYKGPSNVRGARIIATDGDHRRAYSYDHSAYDAHEAAAREFAAEFNWTGVMHAGHTREGMVFVWDNGPQRIRIKAAKRAKKGK